MPNFLENLRLRNIFGGGPTVGEDPYQYRTPPFVPEEPFKFPTRNPFGNVDFGATEPIQQNPFTATNTPAPEDEDAIAAMMSKLYTPETEASDRLNQMITEFPQRNKPGFLRKIGAGLTAYAHGQEAGEKVAYGPYMRAAEDWKAKIGPVTQAAQLEKSANVNERTMAYQTISQHLRNEADRAREALNSRKADIAQQRADIYAFKAKNPNMGFNFSGPTVMVTDPATGKVTDTKIPTGSMTDLDKITLQQEGAERLEGQRQEGRVELEGQRQTGRETLAETRGWTIANIPDPSDPTKQIGVKINQITGEVQPVTLDGKPVGTVTGRGTSAKGETPAQQRIRLNNRINEILARNPDWERYIDRETGQVLPIGTGTGRADLTKQLRDKIVAEIFGTAEPKMERSGAPARTTAAPTKKYRRNKNTGEVQESSDGGKTWHSRSQ